MRIHHGRATRDLLCLTVCGLEHLVKLFPELLVSIPNQDRWCFQSLFSCFMQKHLCLMSYPFAMWVDGGGGCNHSPGFNVNEEEYIGGPRPIVRPDLLGEEIARPECLGMRFKKLTPRRLVLRWLGPNAGLNEDSSDCRFGHIVRSDLGQLPEYSPKSKATFLSYLHDKSSNLNRFAGRTRPFLRPWWRLLPQPSSIGLGLDNRDELLGGCFAQVLAESDKC